MESTHFLKVSKPLYRRTLLELQVRQLAIAGLKVLLLDSPGGAGAPLQAASRSCLAEMHALQPLSCCTLLQSAADAHQMKLNSVAFFVTLSTFSLVSFSAALEQALLLESTRRPRFTAEGR